MRNRYISQLIKNFYARYRKGQVLMSIDIPEISPINTIPSTVETPRINLLVPGVSAKAMFGGVSTALDIFLSLSKNFNDVRIIVTDEIESDISSHKLAGFSPKNLESEASGKIITWAGDRYGKSMPIRKRDLIISTAWWTAYTGFHILDKQKSIFGEAGRKLIYIIQDYEPNFYAWSSRYALALSTYSRTEDTIAIVNSSLLADYLHSKGHNFYLTSFFEPQLNKGLSHHCLNTSVKDKCKLVFVYGRPSVQRNAFELTVQSLRAWASSGEASSNGWQVVSAGEEHDDIDLGGGLVLRSVGKLTVDEYAKLLGKTAVGLSLMISPHPSYPPLELAAFGAGVVTNKFEAKDLSCIHPSIFSVDTLSPSKIAEAIAWKCHEFEIDREINWQRRGKFSWPYMGGKDDYDMDGIKHFLENFQAHN